MLVRSSLVRTATAAAESDVGVLEGLALGRVGDEHRDPQGAGLVEEPVVLVPLDHHHLTAFGLQAFEHPDAHRAEPDHHHVALQPDQLLAAEGLLDPPRHQDVGDQGEDRGEQGGAPGDEEDPEDQRWPVDWWEKEKSPNPTVEMVSTVK